MPSTPKQTQTKPGQGHACIFGATGGIGKALCDQLARERPGWIVHAGSRRNGSSNHANVKPFQFDLNDEASIADAANAISAEGSLDLVIIATGVLHDEGVQPEKTWRSLDPQSMHDVFAVNTIGPAIIAKHFLPVLNKESRSVLAAISARIGSISDNGLGGWHSYRASKAALNMLVRNFAIELNRTNPAGIVAALHPGTVDTALSAPFQRNVPDDQLFSPERSARHLLAVIDDLEAKDSGRHFAWDGSEIPA